ncbi:hypothetical protein EJ377_17875 [Chryseobacterium arthrosphaerae]|uniref:Uncharacterized protein n=1 Tax=Chryseobacterium arthrosphaerae TaxID=651561 RepID=A0A3S0QFJ1_9FLAO|nr:hypothetical protein EJ377_17875 [Chryseobacterium arthrosphaerae]
MAKLHMSDVKGPVSISVYDLSNTTYYTSNKNMLTAKWISLLILILKPQTNTSSRLKKTEMF